MSKWQVDDLIVEIKALKSEIKSMEEELEGIYEAIVGVNGRDRFTHEEFIVVLLEMYDDAHMLQRVYETGLGEKLRKALTEEEEH